MATAITRPPGRRSVTVPLPISSSTPVASIPGTYGGTGDVAPSAPMRK